MNRRRIAAIVWFALAWAILGSSVGLAEPPGDSAVARLLEASPSHAGSPRFAPELLSRGESAFLVACTSCHDAQRSLQKSKSFAAWSATIRRMAVKQGADIAANDREPIAAYLASQTAADAENKMEGVSDRIGAEFFATFAPLFREAHHAATAENPGFFADAWFGVEFSGQSLWRANVTLCTSCHSSPGDSKYSVEVVELSATLDLKRLLCPCESLAEGFEAHVRAGRFVVPFGAYSAMSHPGVNRTLTHPLMFNMGRRVFDSLGLVGPPRQPVLPQPYSDEGINLHTQWPLFDDGSATWDLYGVNGLQDGSVFLSSRSYVDNNSQPALGGRVTVGNRWLRVGASLMGGELQDQGSPLRRYRLAGVDATLKYEDLARFYFEYAIRREDSFALPGGTNTIAGIVAEAEVSVVRHPRLGLLGRFDTLRYRDAIGPNAGIDRFTWGFTIGLPGGALLILNHEHWMFPSPAGDEDVFGSRLVATF